MNEAVQQVVLLVFAYFLLSMVLGILFFTHRYVFRHVNNVAFTEPSLGRAQQGKLKRDKYKA